MKFRLFKLFLSFTFILTMILPILKAANLSIGQYEYDQIILGTSENDIINSIAIKYDDQGNYNGYIAVGSSVGTPVGATRIGSSDGWIIEADANNNLTHQLIGSTHIEDLNFVTIKTDKNGHYNGWIAVGNTWGNPPGTTNNGGPDGWIVECDVNGQITHRLVGSFQIDKLYSIDLKRDSEGNYIGFVAVGGSYSDFNGQTNQGLQDGWIIESDAEGQITQTLLGSNQFDQLNSVKIITNPDGSYNGWVAVGYSEGQIGNIPSNGQSDGWIVQKDINGNINQYLLGGTNTDRLYDLDIRYDENQNYLGFIAVGSSKSNINATQSYGAYDGWIVSADNQNNMTHQLIGTDQNDELRTIEIKLDKLNHFDGFIAAGHSYGTFNSQIGPSWVVESDLNNQISNQLFSVDENTFGFFS